MNSNGWRIGVALLLLGAAVANANEWPVPGNVRGIAVGPTGSVYALGADSVWKFTPNGERITAWRCNQGMFIATNLADDVFVTDGGITIARWNSEGVHLRTWSYDGAGAVRGMSASAMNVLVQSRSEVYVFAWDGTQVGYHLTRNGAGIAASGDHFYEIIGSDGGLLTERDAFGERVWEYEYPRDDSPDELPLYVARFIASGASGRFAVVYSGGTPWSSAPSLEWWDDGRVAARTFPIPPPSAIAQASDGTVYVASGSSVHVFLRDEATAQRHVSWGAIKARWR